MPKKKKVLKRVIGWKEKLDLPDLNLFGIEAKTDTGARTSVLHCSFIEQFKRYRKKYVKFVPFDPGSPFYTGTEFIMPYHTEKLIKNSFGIEENRIIILTNLRLFGQEFPIELSLRDRSTLEYPVLLGRTAIKKRFVVDVSRSDLSDRFMKRKLRLKKK